MVSPTSPRGGRRDHLRRYGVWSLVVVCIFLAGRCAGWGWTRLREAQEQRAVVAALRERGAHVYYDFQQIASGSSERLGDDDGRDARPSWLAQVVGKDLVHRVFYVSFARFRAVKADERKAAERGEIDDRVVQELCRLRGLRWVALNGANVSDAGIEMLADVPRLERLWLSQTRLSDDGLKALAGSEALTHLAVEGTLITDAGIQHLQHLPHLRVLSVGNPQLSDAGIAELRGQAGLTELYLDRSQAGDAAIAAIAGLRNLTVLSLRGTPVSDGGLLELSSLPRLETLHLDGTRIGDRGLAACRSMRNLRHLSLARTRVSDQGLEHLADCRQLESLQLEGTGCTLSGLHRLFVERQRRAVAEAFSAVGSVRRGARGELVALDLRGIRVTDEDARHLEDLDKLQWLSLAGSPLGDRSVPSLLALKNLTLLNLNHTRITDAGLARLAEHRKLRNLHVAGSRVTDNGIADARRRVDGSLRIHRVEYEAASPPAAANAHPG